MKYFYTILLFLVFVNNLSANDSRGLREHHKFAANVTWSPINLPFPSAKGVNGYYIANADWMFGFDYMTSNLALSVLSFEIGEVSESNYTFQAKRFFGNSFNLILGVGSRNTETKLAKNLFDLVTNNYSQTVSKFETKYVRLGVGNQWQFNKNYTFAVDWFSIDIPFSGDVTVSASKFSSSAAKKKEIEYAESILKYYPGGATIRLHFGFIF